MKKCSDTLYDILRVHFLIGVVKLESELRISAYCSILFLQSTTLRREKKLFPSSVGSLTFSKSVEFGILSSKLRNA